MDGMAGDYPTRRAVWRLYTHIRGRFEDPEYMARYQASRAEKGAPATQPTKAGVTGTASQRLTPLYQEG